MLRIFNTYDVHASLEKTKIESYSMKLVVGLQEQPALHVEHTHLVGILRGELQMN